MIQDKGPVDQERKMVEMAVNYTPKQLFDVIVDGTDIEALTDIGRRYPILSVKLAKLDHVAGPVSEILGALPEYLSARKMEKTLRGGASVSDETEAEVETEAEPEPVEEKPAPKKRGRKPKAKPEPDTAEEPEKESDDSKYANMPAPKLFQECKKRGIKAAPKKPAHYYIELLEKADAESDDEADDDETWEI